MKHRKTDRSSRAAFLAAWLVAVICFLAALAFASGVFFSSGGSRYGPPSPWVASQVVSPVERVSGAVLFAAIGVLILVRTYRGVGRGTRKGASRRRKDHA